MNKEIIEKAVKLLVIDDEAALRRSIRGYFEDMDYLVYEGVDGEEGINQVAAISPDVVLVDLRMPGMGGLGFIRHMKINRPELPLIIVSGAGDLPLAVDAIRAGAWDYIAKPILQMEALAHVVDQALERARLLCQQHEYQQRLEKTVEERTYMLELAGKEQRLLADLATKGLKAKESVHNLVDALLTHLADSVEWLTSLPVLTYTSPNDSDESDSLELTFAKHLDGSESLLKDDFEITDQLLSLCVNDDGICLIDKTTKLIRWPNINGYSQACLMTATDAYKVQAVSIFFLADNVRLEPRQLEVLRKANAIIRLCLSRKLAENELSYMAYHDELTGLINQEFLEIKLQKLIDDHRKSAARGIVLIAKIDHFKDINDVLGKNRGDQILKQMAARLRDVYEKKATIGRLSGGRFAVVLSTLEYSDLLAAAESLRLAVSRYYVIEHEESHEVSVSVGVTKFPDAGVNAEAILSRAERALYEGSLEGVATREYHKDMQKHVDSRVRLSQAIKIAITDNQFELYYQPQVGVDKTIIGMEALVRWHHPEHGFMPPDNFISVAEESGLIRPLGLWILRAACKQFVAWSLSDSVDHIAVNVSAVQFVQSDFAESILKVVNETGIKPHHLMLELTEGVLLTDTDNAINKMKKLQEHGVRFSLDDFGTGFSSLSYLKRLPLDQLKIDRSFVTELPQDLADGAIVASVIAVANALKLDLVAEGVENTSQHEFLQEAGCRCFQGYHYAKPLSASDLQLLIL